MFPPQNVHDFLHPHLDFEGPLEATGKEASERPDEGGEGGEGDAVDLERVHPHCLLQDKRHRGVSSENSTACPSFSAPQPLAQLVFMWVNVPPDLG